MQTLERILGCSLDDAREIYSGPQPAGALHADVSALNLHHGERR